VKPNVLTPIPSLSEMTERRSLGLGAGVALVLGNIVGIGIFLTPSVVAKASPNLWTYAAFWMAGGLIATMGALVYAELGSRFPKAGGEYVFLHKAYGRPVAYAWGWLSAAITFPGSIAALFVWASETLASTSFGGWLNVPVFSLGTLSLTWGDVMALAMVWITTAVNCRSVFLSSWLQLIFTWTPIALFLFAGFWSLSLHGSATNISEIPTSTFSPTLGEMSAAFCSVFFAYSGWSVLVYVGGEVKKPGRTIPMAITLALVAATILYLLLNAAFLSVTPLSRLPAVENVGISTARHLFGPAGAEAFAIIMVMAVLACMNVTTMAGSRISLAMARDGYLWKKMANTHPKSQTPVTALLVQAFISSILVLTGSATFLVKLTGSVMFLLSCVTISSLFIFRERDNGVEVPYRSPGYPWIPALYILTGLSVLASLITSNSKHVLVGLGLFCGLVIVHRIVENLKAKRILRT
jgi:basic amino acid/polyamine antiporter, APA family